MVIGRHGRENDIVNVARTVMGLGRKVPGHGAIGDEHLIPIEAL